MLVKYKGREGWFFVARESTDYLSDADGTLESSVIREPWEDGFYHVFSDEEDFLDECDVLLPEEFIHNEM